MRRRICAKAARMCVSAHRRCAVPRAQVRSSSHQSHMAFAEPDRAKLIWGELNTDMLNTALPFKVSVSAVGEDKQPISDS